MSGSMDFSYAVDGKAKKVSTTRNIWTETLLDKTASSASLELKNTGKSTLFARLVAEGIPAEGKEEAYANGLTLAVSYMNHDGHPGEYLRFAAGYELHGCGDRRKFVSSWL